MEMTSYWRRIFYGLISPLCLSMSSGVSAQNPVASPDAVVFSGNAPFKVLTPEIKRNENSENGVF